MNIVKGVVGGRVLLADGEIAIAELAIQEGNISAVGGAVGKALDATGLLVLPGLVDIHGDAFERQLAPRPEVRFPIDMALHDTDRQLLANGITTAFHGITCSWEGGLRGLDMARELVRHLALGRGLAADNRVHLRFENHHLDAVDEVLEWIDEGWVDFLAFNDHLPAMLRRVNESERMNKFAERSGLSVERFRELLLRTAEQTGQMPATVAKLAAQAARCGLAMASHDDMTRADRERYQRLGCAIAEFPMRVEAAVAAKDFDNDVIMGAPNVVRGGSHLGGVSATQMVAEGICTVLASDYFYPAMLPAPFRLAASGASKLADAWKLVSRNPARMAGLADRGEIAVGQRADLVLVDDSRPGFPVVVATLVGGVPCYLSRSLSWH